MIMNMKNLLYQYKDITIAIISSLEKTEYDSVEELLNKRQEVINKLTNLNYSKEEFREVILDIDLLQLNKKALDLINKNKLDLKNKMDFISKEKAAEKSYNSNFYKNVKIFSREV